MSFFIFLTVVQAIVAAALVGVILMQRSEGGGLGVGGGGPSGFMSARGAADFLTRMTAILATVFVVLSIILAAMAVKGSSDRSIDTTLDRSAPAAPAGGVPADPLAGTAQPGSPAAAGAPPTQAPSPRAAPADPLAGAARK
ncbi:MAG: preprotein translocase subunit SecG [Novosphingobium sp.]|nr:preprotein translocase subunit SecG [Novosphingobium sp.]